ncbi:hypothetical protein [Streptomyces longwoodensis]|uniref:hypothetical protein n=1 Tax=Streptomyces longwoodensis TaxID=68231 RepID=UPI00340F7A9E
MIITGTTYFDDADGHMLELTPEEGGSVTIYSHDEIVRFTPSDIPVLVAAIQHTAALAAASKPAEVPA